MEIRPIRTDQDHHAAVEAIERLWHAPHGSLDGDRVEVLATLVDAYERQRWPIAISSPRDILLYAVADMGRSQEDLAALLGSRARASDLLEGRRRLTLEAARKISSAWAIPIQLLVAPYRDAA